jgi:hypothetical protein
VVFDVSVDPGCRVLDAVSAFGAVGADGEEFEARWLCAIGERTPGA